MKTTIRHIRLSMNCIAAIIGGLMLSPMMVGESMAQLMTGGGGSSSPTLCNGPNETAYANCPAGYTCQQTQDVFSATLVYICVANGTTTTPITTPPESTATPEMSDYLALAFLVVAGGMIYRLRRRASGTA